MATCMKDAGLVEITTCTNKRVGLVVMATNIKDVELVVITTGGDG